MELILCNHIDPNGGDVQEGTKIFKILCDNWNTEETISVSFRDLGAVSSSFINTAFIGLLERYSFNEIKSKLRFVDTMKLHNDLIRSRFEYERKQYDNE